MKHSDTYDNVKIVFQNGSNARGIRRSLNETINLAWEFWHTSSIVSNASRSRSSKISAKLFDEDLLLRAVDISQYNIQTNINTRNIKQYSHQDHVQNGTDKQIFKEFGEKYPDVKIGLPTFVKIKPFYIRPCNPSDINTCCRYHVNFRNAVETLLLAPRERKIKYMFNINASGQKFQ